MSKIAVILFNLGGPDSLDAVQPFLENLFNDPDIFKLPFQKQFAKFLSTRRAPKVQKEYELIGGKSPLGYWTEIQRNLLEQSLRESSIDADVHVAMRYWNPLTAETVNKVQTLNYETIVLLPLYPHFSVSTTGSSINEWNRHYKGDNNKIKIVKNYQVEENYLKALNTRINESLAEFTKEVADNISLVFSAHGTPVSFVKKGDPYSHQIKETVDAIMKLRNHDKEHYLCYQSKVGPMKWLEPSTDKMIEELSQQGKKHLLIIPVSFVSDHVETLFELDIEYRHVADACGIKTYKVIKGLNDSSLYTECLKKLVIKSL